jgi:hypothetical protein
LPVQRISTLRFFISQSLDRKIIPLKIESDAHESDEHGDFDKWPDYCGERGAGIDPEDCDSNGDRELEIIARGGER